MGDFDEKSITEAVIARLSDCDDPRFKHVMTSLVRHLHDFVRDVQLTEAEWFTAIQFLTDVGQTCTDKRQEFILLSDTLGRVGAGDLDQSSRRIRLGRIDRAGAVLLGRRARAASRQRSRRRREGRADVLFRPRGCERWQAARERDARHLVWRRRGQLRHADARRRGHEGARQDPHGCAGPLLVPLDPADVLSRAHRWARGSHAAQDGAASVPARAHSHDGIGGGLRARHHASLRRRQRVPRVRMRCSA